MPRVKITIQNEREQTLRQIEIDLWSHFSDTIEDQNKMAVEIIDHITSVFDESHNS